MDMSRAQMLWEGKGRTCVEKIRGLSSCESLALLWNQSVMSLTANMCPDLEFDLPRNINVEEIGRAHV